MIEPRRHVSGQRLELGILVRLRGRHRKDRLIPDRVGPLLVSDLHALADQVIGQRRQVSRQVPRGFLSGLQPERHLRFGFQRVPGRPQAQQPAGRSGLGPIVARPRFGRVERLGDKRLKRIRPEIKARRRLQLAAVVGAVDELRAVNAKPNKNAYAIVIGIEQYRQKLPKADFAVADAKMVTEYLTKLMGYPEENIVTLTNEYATKSDFEKYFERWLLNNTEKDSTVFVYYSGHGAPDPKNGGAYLVPYDGDPSFIAETGYSLKRMYDALGKLPAKEIIVALDSCFSGAGGRSVIAKGARPLVMNLQNNVVLSKHITSMAAASGDQFSSTYDEKGHGLFTYYMLKGIKYEDVIKQDGSIAISDLFDYLKPQVERVARKQYNNEQTPQLIGPK